MNAPTRGIPLRPDRDAAQRAALASLVRAAHAVALAAVDGTVRPAELIAGTWRDDRDALLILKGPVAPTDTTALRTVATAFMGALRPLSAAVRVLERGIQLSFDHASQISVPALAWPAVGFVGQGQPIPSQAGTTSTAALLEPSKLASLCELTAEMLRNANAQRIVETAMTEAAAAALDLAFFSAAAGVPDLRPAGILNGIAALPATAGAGADAMLTDLGNLVQAIAAASGGGAAFVTAPKQAVRMGAIPNPIYPTFVSGSVPEGTVIAIASAGICSALESAPDVDASRHGTIHEADPASPVVDIGGVMAAPVRSLFQTDSTSLRLRWPMSWARRSPSAVAWISGATW